MKKKNDFIKPPITTILKKKLGKIGYAQYLYWYDIFIWDYNFPPGKNGEDHAISEEYRQTIAHNLALQVVWSLPNKNII